MAKRKVTVTIDEDILDTLTMLGAENVSSVVNDALRSRVESIAHNQALGELLASWREQYKPPSERARKAARLALQELDGVDSSQVA
jgi:Arc/MetJ family transcription regulator